MYQNASGPESVQVTDFLLYTLNIRKYVFLYSMAISEVGGWHGNPSECVTHCIFGKRSDTIPLKSFRSS